MTAVAEPLSCHIKTLISCMKRDTGWHAAPDLHAKASQIVGKAGGAPLAAVKEAAEAVQVWGGALLKDSLQLVMLQAVRKVSASGTLHSVVPEQNLLQALHHDAIPWLLARMAGCEGDMALQHGVCISVS